MTTFDDQLASFNADLPQIRAEFGEAWTVYFNRVMGTFSSFEDAASFAFSTLRTEDFVIKHTYEEPEFVPFILVG